MTDQKLLEIKNLSVEYRTEDEIVYAVNSLNLSLNSGESLGLVGETGAGKTTTALSILRLVPDPPGKVTSGEIIFEGEDLLKAKLDYMRDIRGNKISMIFQDPMTSLNPVYTVGDQIAEAILLHENCSKADARKKAAEMLEMVGIPKERYDEYPHQFSGGMKQRVVIAMSLACSPKLILADEPTTALDVTIQAQVLELMNELKVKFNTSLLLITHDLGVVAQICDKVAIMYAGEIVEMGTAEEIFEHPHHPYTIGLFESIPTLDNKVEKLKPIKGQMPDPTNLLPGCSFHPRCPYMHETCCKIKPATTSVTGTHLVRCLVHEGKVESPELLEEVKNGR
jgi:peptide/nickel transport system ATP-binding protein